MLCMSRKFPTTDLPVTIFQNYKSQPTLENHERGKTIIPLQLVLSGSHFGISPMVAYSSRQLWRSAPSLPLQLSYKEMANSVKLIVYHFFMGQLFLGEIGRFCSDHRLNFLALLLAVLSTQVQSLRERSRGFYKLDFRSLKTSYGGLAGIIQFF